MKLNLPPIPESERTELIDTLLGLLEKLVQDNSYQKELIQQLRDEIAILKGEKGQPKFSPSGMEQNTGTDCESAQSEDGTDESPKKRPGSEKRHKKKHLPIHATQIVTFCGVIPDDSVFKGYDNFVVQDIRFEVHNICYRREIWLTPEGQWLRAELPDYQKGQTFGPTLRQFVLYQHHHCQVTQPLIHEQLKDIGVDISSGQINRLLTQRCDGFIAEQQAILQIGLQHSDYINVDDSGARHQGKTGYVTHIGNEAFTYFCTTFSKSRINFLELLQAGTPLYVYNDRAFDYVSHQGLPKNVQDKLQKLPQITNALAWEKQLDSLAISNERHRRIATEGALLGGLIANGFNPELIIVSDGAGQFAILQHALCWVHAERLIHKLIPLNEPHREDIARVRSDLWDLYADLKRFRDHPLPELSVELEARFDTIFSQKTSFQTLNQLLKRLHQHKDELLLVLKHPQIPLHNNLSENDIREHVKKRKISGGTRSDLGRQCRDALTSLKKTCRKQRLSFWNYLGDRIKNMGEIEPLADLVRGQLLGA